MYTRSINNAKSKSNDGVKPDVVFTANFDTGGRRSQSIATTNGTIPYTVKQAIELCSNRVRTSINTRKSKQNESRCNYDSCSDVVHQTYGNTTRLSLMQRQQAPIDLLVLVLRVHHDVSASNQPYVRLYITDTSITNTNTVEQVTNDIDEEQYQILYFGQRRCNDLMETIQIQSGDILRCNRMTILQSSNNAITTNSNRNRITFSNDLYEPESNGPEYYKFGNVLSFNQNCNNNLEFHSIINYSSNCNNNIHGIPQSMETSIQCIQHLVQYWYSSHRVLYPRVHLSLLRKNSNSVNGESYAHHQHYTLMELVSSIGLIGHTTAFVVQIIEKPVVHITKRNVIRSKYATTKHQQHRSTTNVLYVTLTDELISSNNHTYSTFIISSNTNGNSKSTTASIDQQYYKFYQLLKEALRCHCPIVLYNIQSSTKDPIGVRSQMKNMYKTLNDLNVVLVPTSTTNIQHVPYPIKQLSYTSSPESQQESTQLSYDVPFNDDDVNIIIIQSPIIEIHDYSSSTYIAIKQGVNQEIRSHLEDQELKLQLKQLLSFLFLTFSDDSDFSANDPLNQVKDTNYVATVRLQYKNEQTLINKSFIDVHTSNTMMLYLFGGNLNVIRKAFTSNSQQEQQLQRKMVLVLYSLMIERVPLQWTIQRTKQCNNSNATKETCTTAETKGLITFDYRLMNVSLPEL